MAHKAGFVNIVGNPNVGKSTLMNVLVGEKLSIITSKSQTTRHRIMGIVSGEDFQIVYSDTPGVLKPNYKLQESMMNFATSALIDADVLIYVTDIYDNKDKNQNFFEMVKKLTIPILVVINKIDQSNQEALEVLVETYAKEFPTAEIIPTSALEKFNTDILFNRIISNLPESEAYFPKDQLTDKSERFFVQEIIREKVLTNYDKEVPYSVEVEVEEFVHEEKIIRIGAVIHVARDSQKGIIIGHKGEKLKKVGTSARIDMEEFLGKKVFLQLFVKVNKEWRDKPKALKNFGYNL
jgi:GTP-binding protein Era